MKSSNAEVEAISKIFLDQLHEIAQERQNLVILTAYMSAHNYSAAEVAYAVEKPLKFGDVLEAARAELRTEIDGARSRPLYISKEDE